MFALIGNGDNVMEKYKNLEKFQKFKIRIKRYYKIAASTLAFIVNTVGLILSFCGAFGSPSEDNEQKFILFLLIAAELFLIVSVLYSTISMVKSYYDKEMVDVKERELSVCRESNAIIFENFKRNITDYKDFKNRLDITVEKHCQVTKQHENLKVSTSETDGSGEINKQIEAIKNTGLDNLKDSLIEQYNRFMIKTLDSLRDSIEEYLASKGCKRKVAVALKQLKKPVEYSKIDNYKGKKNVYTAFRDSRTYFSKTRNETWQKRFSISKNSDFMLSIEKDYYIFNFMNKTYMENGLYLNENNNFYENYNSGVTCTIYSCVGEERVLYGFLACDSLLSIKNKAASGKTIYDYNVANLLMSAAHIIALYLQELLDVWEKYYIKPQIEKIDLLEEKKKLEEDLNLCSTLVSEIKGSRYIG